MTDTELIGGEEPSRHNAIAPPVAAGSVDTEEFRILLRARENTPHQSHPALAAYINAWGAQQHEAGYHEGVEQLRHERDKLLELSTENLQRAEKAEARVKELEAELTAMKSRVGPIHCTAASTTYPVSEDFRYKILSDHRRMEMPDGFGPIDPRDIPC